LKQLTFWENEKDIGKTTVDSWRHEPWRRFVGYKSKWRNIHYFKMETNNYASFFATSMRISLLLIATCLVGCYPKVCLEYSCYSDVYRQIIIDNSKFNSDFDKRFVDSALGIDSFSVNSVTYISNKYKKDSSSMTMSIELIKVIKNEYLFRIKFYEYSRRIPGFQIVDAYPYYRKFKLRKGKFFMKKD